MYELLCGYRADEGRFGDVCVPSMSDDSCHAGAFSRQRAYCMYLLCAVNSSLTTPTTLGLCLPGLLLQRYFRAKSPKEETFG